MAVVVYQCDTCKRELHRKQNRGGLDIVGHCIITDGCRGRLMLNEVKPSYAIGHSTQPVIGLKDWSPRKVLFTYEQKFLKKVWEVEHGLRNQPSIATYVYREDELVRVVPESIEYKTNDLAVITFATAVTGIAQCQARSASDGQNITTLLPRPAVPTDSTTFSLTRSIPLTNGTGVGELTIATRVSTIAVSGFSPTQPIKVNLHFLSPTDLEELVSIPVELEFRDVNNTPVDNSDSPWGGTRYVSIHGHKYLIRSANIHTGGSFGQTLTDRGIPQGAACYFSVQYLKDANNNWIDRDLVPGEILILQSDAPHSTVDRIYDSAIEMTDITKQNATATTAYVGLDLLGNNSLPKNIFPSIILL